MPQTVLITGSSTGIGKATAKYFLEKGWNVIATMRTPEKETELSESDRCMLAKLDVTDEASIQSTLDAAISRFGHIDVLVNNAGYGLSGSFESMSMAQIRRQFDTNVFGLMAVCKAILPHFRGRKAGTLVNVASMGGRCTFPLYSIYHGTKWAVDGFSESLQFELKPLGIHVKIIEPGAIKTDFYDRSAEVAHNRELGEYNDYVDKAQKAMDAAGNKGLPPVAVAKVIYKAANDQSWRQRYMVGPDAKGLITLRRFIGDRAYQFIVKQAVA